MPKIQNIHDTITILSAACKHQPSCSPDATHDTHHFFPGIGSSCWKVAVIFFGGDAFPMNHLEKFAFTTLHQFWTTLSRMWFGHQYLWAQNLFSDLQMRGMDVCPSLLFGGGCKKQQLPKIHVWRVKQTTKWMVFVWFCFSCFFEFRWNLEVLQNPWTPSYFPCFWKIHQLGWGSFTLLRYISLCKPDLQTWSNRKFRVLDL